MTVPFFALAQENTPQAAQKDADGQPQKKVDIQSVDPDETTAEDLKKTPLSLQDAIDAAMRGNLNLIYTRFEPEKSRQNIEIEKAVFDPEINFSLTYTDTKDSRSSSHIEGAETPRNKHLTYNFNVQKKVETGGSVKVWTGSNRNETNSHDATLNPYYTANIGVDVSQPILRGAGLAVNLAPIAIARSQRKESELALRKKILDTILNSEIAYWNLSAAYAFRDLRRSNLELAKKLLEENKAKFGVGLIRRQDVLQAEANIAEAEEKMISAEQLIQQNNDELLGTFGRLEFDNNPMFAVAVLPQDKIELPNFEGVVAGALNFDLDMQIALEAIERSKLEHIVAKDNVNPSLNLRAGASVLSKEDDYLESYKRAIQRKGYSWNAGMDFSMPWGFREERAREAKSKISLRQSQVNLANVRQDLMQSLRSAYRDLEAGIETRRSAARTLALNMESFDQQKALYDVGLATFRDVLQAQRDLDESKSRYLDAVYSVIIARAKLSRLDGTILARHSFTWGDLGEYELPPSANSES
ncbi:MAG: TolC family protein [Opitutales bacterium]|nr:TolC family protein [Opitutales bacterium]